MKDRSGIAIAVASLAAVGGIIAGFFVGGGYKPLTQANFAEGISKASEGVESVHMSMSASKRLAIAADFSYVKPVAMQMDLTVNADGKTSKIAMKLVGKSLYMQVPPATPAGKWIQFDAASAGVDTSQYKDLGPQGLSDQFKEGVRSIKYVGETTIDGVSSHQYELIADSSQLGSSLKALAAAVPDFANLKTLTEQVYVSDKNVLQRISITLPAPVGNMQIDFTKWNEPVTISAPAAADLYTPGKS